MIIPSCLVTHFANVSPCPSGFISMALSCSVDDNKVEAVFSSFLSLSMVQMVLLLSDVHSLLHSFNLLCDICVYKALSLAKNVFLIPQNKYYKN